MQNKRRQVPPQERKQFPYNCIVGIELQFAPQGKKVYSSASTGFLITSELVLTPAHSFSYQNLEFGQIKSITVSFEGGRVTLSTANIRINDDYLKQIQKYKNQQKKTEPHQLAKLDFALIKLPQKITRKEYFILEKNTSHNSQEIKVTACGYDPQNNLILYEDRNRIKIQKDVELYKIDTRYGQDGSPVFLTQQKNKVIGIHVNLNIIQKAQYYSAVSDYFIQTVQNLKKQLLTSENKFSILDQYQDQNCIVYRKPNSQQCSVSPKVHIFQKLQCQSQLQPPNKSIFQQLKGITQKESLHDLKFLRLKGQVMKQNYVKLLSKCQLPALKEINLNDNNITLAGVVQLVFNKLKQQVTYILDSVETTDGGYVLNIGQSIPIIKKIIKDRTNISHDAIDSMNDAKELYEALYLMMEMPFEGKQQEVAKESAMFQNRMKKIIEDNKDQISFERLFLTLKQRLGDSRVTFTKNSNIKSQLTWRILTLQMMHKRVMIKHKINHPRCDFKQFHKNRKQIMNFQEWYLSKLPKSCNLQDLRIHKLVEGSIVVVQSVSSDNPILADRTFVNQQKITIIPFFQSFTLSPEDFDPSYNYQYDDVDSVNHYQRGGIPFYQPIRCQKFAIKVQDIYDDKTNHWLEMGHPRQWGVAFHGINRPGSIVPATNQTILQAIMSGRTKGEMLREGQRQLRKSDIAVNKPNQKVGDGIYISPYFTTSLLDYTQPVQKNGQTYRVVLMARFRPQALKITSVPQYWVINKSKNVRPYAILLFTPQQYSVLEKLKDKIQAIDDADKKDTKVCHWDKWKENYFEFRRFHKLD